ncbi:MAG: hypothetical protein Q4A54_00585 [Parabacteroides sp.]|nr:hypothetical protein [Parabacteroides sp.]
MKQKNEVSMSKKYIIEFKDKPRTTDYAGDMCFECVTAPWMVVPGSLLRRLTPYVDPDVEGIRGEAYTCGFDDGYKAGLHDKDLKKEDQEFKIGDEVESEVSGLMAYIIDINTCDETPWDFHCITKDFVSCYFLSKKNLRKTGKNIPELAEIMKKMREV